MSATPSSPARPGLTGRAWPRPALVAVGLGVFLLAGLTVLVTVGGRIRPSSDPGSPSTHVGWGWLAAAVLLAVCAATSRRLRPTQSEPGPRIGADLAVLLACAMAFPLVMRLPVPWAPGDYVLVKVVLLLAVPALVLWWTHRRVGPGVRWVRPRLSRAALTGALLGIVAHQAITQLGPGAATADLSRYDRTTLVVAATATALTASIGEEVFYRYWLQTRLEALFGAWAGILTTAVVFGLMHLASHTAGYGLGLGTAIVVANQGVSGIVLGYLWSRYRRLWMPILLHLSVNGLQVVLFLAGLG